MARPRRGRRESWTSVVITVCALLWIAVSAVWVSNLLGVVAIVDEEHRVHEDAQAFAAADFDATARLVAAADPLRWGQPASSTQAPTTSAPVRDQAAEWTSLVTAYGAASQLRSAAAASILNDAQFTTGAAGTELLRTLIDLQGLESSVVTQAGNGDPASARQILASAAYLDARSDLTTHASTLYAAHEAHTARVTADARTVMFVGSLVSAVTLVLLLMVVTVDIRRRLVAQNLIARELEEQSTTDSLTGARTRTSFLADLAEGDGGQAPGARREHGGQVVYVDIDQFGRLNEELGHRTADAVLQGVAALLRETLCQRDDASLGRMGADSFAALMPPPTSPAEAERAVGQLLRILDEPLLVTVDGHDEPIPVSVAAGIAPAPGHGGPSAAADSLRHAEAAAARATTDGGQRVRRFDEGMLAEEQLARDLLVSLDNGDVVAHFQPVWRVLPDGAVTMEGVEALARWEHPELGQISPVVFVPLSVQIKRERRLTHLMLDQACHQLAQWRHRLGPIAPTYVAVNVGVTEVDAGLPALVAEITHRHSLPTSCLLLEITEETAALQPEIVSDVCRRLRRLGVRLAVDDFGTGYSSLHRLNSLGFDVLKIDRSLTNGIGNARTAPLLDATLAMANGLGATCVVEGVETWEQFDYLRARGANAVQGFLFSPARAAADIEDLLVRGVTGQPHDARLPRSRVDTEALDPSRG